MSRKTSQAGEAEIGATDRAQRQSLHAHDGAGRAQQQTPEIISENKQTDTFSADRGRPETLGDIIDEAHRNVPEEGSGVVKPIHEGRLFEHLGVVMVSTPSAACARHARDDAR